MENDTKSKLGLFSIVLLGLNTIVGTGIYLLPSKPMALVGPSSILIYLLVTLIVMSIALCFAECATFFSRNGAAYLYAKEAFGDFVGYQVGVLKWVVSSIAWAASAVGFTMILGEIVPAVAQEPYRSILIAGLIISLGVLNVLGVKHVKFVSNLVALTKMVPLFFFLILGLFYIEIENFAPFVPHDMGFGKIGEASLVIFFAFSGFETLAVAAEDMDNPQKNIPLAIMIVLIVSAVIYLLTQLVVVGILGEALAFSITPIADAASVFFGEHGKLIILLSTLISSIGINIASSFTVPRTVEVLAKDKLIPAFFAKKHVTLDTPIFAIVLSVAVTIAAALSGSFIKLVTISVIARLYQYIPTCLAVFILRNKYKNKISFFPKYLNSAIPILGVIFALWLLTNASWDEFIWGSGAAIISAPFYFITHKKQSKRDKVKQAVDHAEVDCLSQICP